MEKKPYWVSFTDKFEHMREFEYHGPWWESGITWDDNDNELVTICLAVMAESEEAAQDAAIQAFDRKDGPVGWRFSEPMPEGWTPFELGSRFPMAEWMKWPWPEEQK